MEQFTLFKSSMFGAIKLLRKQKADENAVEILNLLQSSFIQFDMWGEDIVNLNEANLNYVSGMYEADKRFLVDGKKEIKKFEQGNVRELERSIRRHEEIGRQERDKIKKLDSQICAELKTLTSQADLIIEKLKNGDVSAILKEVKPIFSLDKKSMVEFDRTVEKLKKNSYHIDLMAKDKKAYYNKCYANNKK